MATHVALFPRQISSWRSLQLAYPLRGLSHHLALIAKHLQGSLMSPPQPGTKVAVVKPLDLLVFLYRSPWRCAVLLRCLHSHSGRPVVAAVVVVAAAATVASAAVDFGGGGWSSSSWWPMPLYRAF